MRAPDYYFDYSNVPYSSRTCFVNGQVAYTSLDKLLYAL
jgi:hypothetical protein